MNVVLIAFLLGLLIGLACNRRAVVRRSEIIRWACEDIDRYADIADHVEATEAKAERWRTVALKATRRARAAT